MYIASRHRNIHRNRDSYKMALHSICETMAEEMTVDWRILRNDRVRTFHSITPIITGPGTAQAVYLLG